MEYFSDFYNILKNNNVQEREEQAILFIEQNKNLLEKDEDRKWLLQICELGSLNLIHYCEKNMPQFSLYDHSKEVNHYGNLGFLRAILSGDLTLIDYFFNHKDFSYFMERKDIVGDIARTIESYKDNCKRHNHFDSIHIQRYQDLLFYFAKNTPQCCSEIFDKAARANENDEISPILTKFLQKYEENLIEFLSKNDNDSLTILFMLNIDHGSYQFAENLCHQFKSHTLEQERVEIMLYWGGNHNIKQLQWLVGRPDLYQLNSSHFHALFKQIFEHPLQRKIRKDDYEYLDEVIRHNLYQLDISDFSKAIARNMTPLVKKYHNLFKKHNFSYLYEYNNTCTNFLNKCDKEKQYKELNKKLTQQTVQSKKLKV